jgi:Raf kinase inhibitor-like YbhB/YbcL family protein
MVEPFHPNAGEFFAFAATFLRMAGSLRTPVLIKRSSVALFAWLVLSGCHATPPAAEGEGVASLVLHSPSLRDGRFPEAFTCSGANTSPALSWNTPPTATKSLALILNDPDAPSGSFVHWVLFDLPPGTVSLPEAVPSQGQLSDGSRQGRNDFGDIGYGGPCPPGHAEHRYVLMLFALDTKLNLPSGAMRDQIDAAMKGHVLARGSLTATFSR